MVPCPPWVTQRSACARIALWSAYCTTWALDGIVRSAGVDGLACGDNHMRIEVGQPIQRGLNLGRILQFCGCVANQNKRRCIIRCPRQVDRLRWRFVVQNRADMGDMIPARQWCTSSKACDGCDDHPESALSKGIACRAAVQSQRPSAESASLLMMPCHASI